MYIIILWGCGYDKLLNILEKGKEESKMATVFERLSSQLDIWESVGIINTTDPTNIHKPVEVFSAIKTILKYTEDDFNNTLDDYNIPNPDLYHKSKVVYNNLLRDYPLFFKPIPSRWKNLFKLKRRKRK